MADPIPLPDVIAKCEQARALLQEVNDAIGTHFPHSIGASWDRVYAYTLLDVARTHIGSVLYTLQVKATEPKQ